MRGLDREAAASSWHNIDEQLGVLPVFKLRAADIKWHTRDEPQQDVCLPEAPRREAQPLNTREGALQRALQQALAESNGSYAAVDRKLGVARSTIYRMLKLSGAEPH